MDVVGRQDQDNINSVFTLSGSVVSLKSGGHRIYWRQRKTAYELPNDPDQGFKAMVKLGFLRLGKIKLIIILIL